MNEPILDKAPKPPGLLPKHLQSWLIVGLAVLMVLIMWLTGGKKPQVTSKPGASLGVSAPLVDVNEGKITELQNRIQELQREQLLHRTPSRNKAVYSRPVRRTARPRAVVPAAPRNTSKTPSRQNARSVAICRSLLQTSHSATERICQVLRPMPRKPQSRKLPLVHFLP